MSPFSFDPCTFRWTQIQHGTGLDHLTPGRHFPYRNCSSETLCLIVHLSELHTCSRSMEVISLEITHSINTQVFLTESFWKLSPLDTQVWAHIPALVFPLLCSWWGKRSMYGWITALWSILTWDKPIFISHCWHLSQQMQELQLLCQKTSPLDLLRSHF